MEEIFAALFWLAFIGVWLWAFVIIVRGRRSPVRHAQQNGGALSQAHVPGHIGFRSRSGLHRIADPGFEPHEIPPGCGPSGAWADPSKQAAADSARSHDEVMEQMLR